MQPVFQAPEQAAQSDHGRNGQNDLGTELGPSQAVQGEEAIENVQGGNFQYYLTENGEDQGVPSQAAGLEDTHRQEVGGKEGEGQAHGPQERAAEGDHLRVAHKQSDELGTEKEVAGGDHHQEGHRDFGGEGDAVLHASVVSAGVVVTDQGHETLRQAHGHIHGYHVDFVGDAHGYCQDVDNLVPQYLKDVEAKKIC